MTPVRLAAAAAAWLALASLSGCAATAPRATAVQLDQDSVRAFRRAYDAQRRMTTGRADEDLIKQAWGSCRPLEPGPRDDRAWRWACRIAYLGRSPVAWTADRGEASYVIGVDARGCFTATSADYPRRVYERILRRPSPNPLARFVSCPERPAEPR